MVVVRTDTATPVAAVRMLCRCHVPDGGTEQRQFADTNIQPYDFVCFHGAHMQFCIFVPFRKRRNDSGLRRFVLRFVSAFISRPQCYGTSVLCLLLRRTCECAFRSVALLCAVAMGASRNKYGGT